MPRSCQSIGNILNWPLKKARDRTTFVATYSTLTSPKSQNGTPSFIEVSAEVAAALAANKPVVALETTIYTHGFPYPDNVALAIDLEEIVRLNGAIPATIGILNGVAKVGLSTREIIDLASAFGKQETMKVSRRDLPYVLGMGISGRKLNGGTTVAATMYLAERSGIKVFGTGGLGGVHRGGEVTMDVSADLTELGKTSMAVVASGCKSFLDIPRTLEYLETQGATVATFKLGREGVIDFPAFFTQDSGVASPMVIENEREAAALIYAQELLGASFRAGILLANPIPAEYSIPKKDIDSAINQAVKQAADQGVHGHANTPFILNKIKELTKGNSIPANRALIESNVAMASKVAAELCRFRVELASSAPEISKVPNRSTFHSQKQESEELATEMARPDVIVVGSLAVDLACDYSPSTCSGKSDSAEPSLRMHTSNPARITPSVGGVGHNVALAAHRVGGNLGVRLCSIVGNDIAGETALAAMKSEGLDTRGVVVAPSLSSRTAQYVSINDANKNLVFALADMSIFQEPGTGLQEAILNESQPRKWTVIDANFSPQQLKNYLKRLKTFGGKIAYEPVSAAKSSAIFEPYETAHGAGSSSKTPDPLRVFPEHELDLATPNQHELAAMHTAAKKYDFFESERWWNVIDAFGIPSSGARDRFVSMTNRRMTDEGIPLRVVQLLPYIPTILTKLGPEGVLLAEILKPGDPRLTDASSVPYILSRCMNGSTEIGGIYLRLFPAVELVSDVVSVNGAGDTFLGVLVAGLAKGLSLDKPLIDVAQKGAVLTLRSKEAVSTELCTLARDLDLK